MAGPEDDDDDAPPRPLRLFFPTSSSASSRAPPPAPPSPAEGCAGLLGREGRDALGLGSCRRARARGRARARTPCRAVPSSPSSWARTTWLKLYLLFVSDIGSRVSCASILCCCIKLPQVHKHVLVHVRRLLRVHDVHVGA